MKITDDPCVLFCAYAMGIAMCAAITTAAGCSSSRTQFERVEQGVVQSVTVKHVTNAPDVVTLVFEDGRLISGNIYGERTYALGKEYSIMRRGEYIIDVVQVEEQRELPVVTTDASIFITRD